MSIFGFIVLGLIIGSIVKSIMPGKVHGGFLTSLVLGVVGAIVGGILGSLIFNIGLGGFFNLRTWFLSLIGGVVVAGVYGAVKGRK